jgi:hypothetical protein
MPPDSKDRIEEVGLLSYHFDTQAFLFAAHNMVGGEFAALDTLQYGLARDAERAHCLAHRQEVLAGITVEAILELFGEADTPRGAGCRLLAGNNAVIGQAMDGRGATPGTTAAFLIVSSSPSGAQAVGSKQEIPQWRRRLPTRPAVKR